MKRAANPNAKAERRAAILAAAGEAFDRLGFAAVSMAWLAERVGLAKGTLYLYFPSKEALFLALYLDELNAWFGRINRELTKNPRHEPAQIAGQFVDALDAQPRLPPLAAILHVVLERNISEEEALAFKRHLLNRVSQTGALVEQLMSFLQPGDGARLLLRLHALIIGTWNAATPAPVARRVLEREEMAALRLDFSEELENTLVLLLEGWRRSGGGF